jgi:hypothetical protein
VHTIQITNEKGLIPNLQLKVLFCEFHRRTNLMALLFSNLGFKNNTKKVVSQLGWLKVKFLIVVNMEFKFFTKLIFLNSIITDDVYDHNFFRKKSKILRFDVFLT